MTTTEAIKFWQQAEKNSRCPATYIHCQGMILQLQTTDEEKEEWKKIIEATFRDHNK